MIVNEFRRRCEMSVYETVGRNQKQALLALHHGGEAVLDVVKPFMSRTEWFWKMMRELPYADHLPTARESVEQWFGFFDGTLKEGREFAFHLVDMLPAHRATHAAVKSTTKAA
jgi:hypothetical protein